MTFNEAVATYAPAWVGIWINFLLLGAIVLPLVLFFWKPTRLVALSAIVAGVVSVAGIMFLYSQLGYVKLLGLPHIIAWVPLAYLLWSKIKSAEVTTAPRVIMSVVLATIAVSLAFDVVDVARYAAGERTALAMPA
ncbi:MAG: hypothetical protein ABJF50_03770 [Paracoccaceae bacterium]